MKRKNVLVPTTSLAAKAIDIQTFKSDDEWIYNVTVQTTGIANVTIGWDDTLVNGEGLVLIPTATRDFMNLSQDLYVISAAASQVTLLIEYS